MVVKFKTGAILSESIDLSKDVFRTGDRCRDDRGEYILIKFNNGAGNDAAVVGQMLAGYNTDASLESFEGTNDLNTANVNLGRPWGQMMSAPSDGEGVWCKYNGYSQDAGVTDGTAAAGSTLVLDGATVGGVQLKTALTQREVGVALADDSGNVIAAGAMFLDIPL